ncbi:hypothetical protein SBV1_1400023 [Verrucomicrobia bacterium]|nr:hypothetical protein SBV1_1400023 [Verrucomicrobiota bacterium]
MSYNLAFMVRSSGFGRSILKNRVLFSNSYSVSSSSSRGLLRGGRRGLGLGLRVTPRCPPLELLDLHNVRDVHGTFP